VIGSAVAELSGRTVTYGYDDLFRLTSETIAGAVTQNGAVSYQYDSVGNRTKITSTLPAFSSSGLINYDANDRTATDPYDANGNLLVSGAGGNVYDFENRLVGLGPGPSSTTATATASAKLSPRERQHSSLPIRI
jgi:hypothetical protein